MVPSSAKSDTGYFWYIRQDGTFCINGNAAKPGGGAWQDVSDARIKTVHGDYVHGLDQILQLKPVRYAFKGNDTDTSPVNVEPHPSPAASGDPIVVPYRNSLHYKQARTGNEFIGLIAQDVEDVLPECIKMAAGFIDGEAVTDLRTLDTSPILYALINAVKALKAEIETLKAGR